ncbi:MAG: energy transducer TonB [Myxococcales bacterium FL481]|nr:MAG: energy transducer TonB [Myxococcales bacterium FL481]
MAALHRPCYIAVTHARPLGHYRHIEARCNMFSGFEPGRRSSYFPRRRKAAGTVTVLLHVLAIWGVVVREQNFAAHTEEEVDVEIDNLVPVEEAEEPEEPEPEEPEPEFDDPPPSPTPRAKTRAKPAPRPEIVAPDSISEGAEESNVDRAPVGGSGGGSGTGKATQKAPPKEPPKEEPKPKPKPKAKKKKGLPFDPSQPQAQLPKGAKPAKLKPGVARTPVYPPDLRKQNITGTVSVRILVDRKGNIKKVQVLRKEAAVPDDEKKAAWAKKKFLKSVADLLKTWNGNYIPASYNGTPITVWVKVKFPFTLK